MSSGSSPSVDSDVSTDVRTYSKGSIQLGSNDAIEVTLSATFTTTDTYTPGSGTPEHHHVERHLRPRLPRHAPLIGG